MKFEINQVMNVSVIISKCANGQATAILVAIFFSNHRTKPTFELGREINESNDNQYSKTSKIQTLIFPNTP